MEITVEDLCNLYIEEQDEVRIWSNQADGDVFNGNFRQAMECMYSGHEVMSFGVEDGIICINIE